MLSKHCNPVHIVLPKLTLALLIATPSLRARGTGSELDRRARSHMLRRCSLVTLGAENLVGG